MANDTPIGHVTDTAFWVATYRADESARPDRLFDDPLAARLVEGRGRETAARMREGGLAAWLLAIRTRIIDDRITRALGEGHDVVVNLGAGLDTRPYRLAGLTPNVRWIEVDFPSTIDFKEERLAGETPRCQLERVRLDLGDTPARQRFFAELEKHGGTIFVLTEGVIPYLDNDTVATLAAELHALPNLRSWLVEYFTKEFLVMRSRLGHLRARQMRNAPFKFAPSDWSAFFAERGWSPADIHYLGEEAARFGRPPPLSWWRRIAFGLVSEARRRSLRRNYGYAVLTKRASG